MRILDEGDSSNITIQFTGPELATLFAATVELLTGANALDDEDWDMHVYWPREGARQLVDELSPVVKRFTDTQ